MAGLCEGGNEPPGSLKAMKRGSAKSSQDRERAYRPTYGFHCGQYTCTLQSISGGTYRGRLGAPVHCILHQEYLCARNMNLSNVMDVVMRTINLIRSKGLNHRDFRALLDGINSMGIYSTIPSSATVEAATLARSRTSGLEGLYVRTRV
ncbi:hypothetical protein ANN_12132 [Periplaneta americana]|uniref:Uncharacterized protein n=1 Tax=Periplaneta americana TaxID=6978 RepID=A0ABQ8T854_PERAM|nr:hypothetical protein ANN_12132 [Periplaneta americana]